jgi:hypothetical protein
MFSQEKLQENKTYFINILVQIIVKEYYIFIEKYRRKSIKGLRTLAIVARSFRGLYCPCYHYFSDFFFFTGG